MRIPAPIRDALEARGTDRIYEVGCCRDPPGGRDL